MMPDKFVFDSHFDDDASSPDSYSFEGCCGAAIWAEFAEDSLDYRRRMWKSEWVGQVDYWYEENHYSKRPKMPSDSWFEKEILKQTDSEWCGHPGLTLRDGHVYMCILIASQLWLKPLLVKRGFRLVSDRTVNAETGNKLYMFLRDPVSKKGKPPKKNLFRK